MNYYALFYELVDDMVTRRVPFREEHLRLAAQAHERGELALAGRFPAQSGNFDCYSRITPVTRI